MGRRSPRLALADSGEFVGMEEKAVKCRALKDALVGCSPRLQAKAVRDKVSPRWSSRCRRAPLLACARWLPSSPLRCRRLVMFRAPPSCSAGCAVCTHALPIFPAYPICLGDSVSFLCLYLCVCFASKVLLCFYG